MAAILEDVFALRDVLGGFLRGEPPDYRTQAATSLFHTARSRAVRFPDHYFTALRDRLFGRADSWSELVLIALAEIDQRYFDNRTQPPLHVRRDRFGAWQNLIAALPPVLPIAAALLRRHGSLHGIATPHERLTFFTDFVRRQVGQSILPTIRDPFLEALIEERGLTELHMHLNGTLEGDAVWHAALADPHDFCDAFFAEVKGKRRVAQLLRQEEHSLSPTELAKRLRLAESLQRYLAIRVFSDWPEVAQEFWDGPPTFREFLQSGGHHRSLTELWGHRRGLHPTEIILRGGADRAGAGALETFFVAAILSALRYDPNSDLGDAAYLYFLLQAQFWRLLVQQRDQYGFDQFQAITSNGLRELPERTYVARFRQLHYSEPGDIVHLEGRIAPKLDAGKLVDLLGETLTGYLRYRRSDAIPPRTLGALLDAVHTSEADAHSRRFGLGLVVHFIKEADRPYGGDRAVLSCRHRALRVKHQRQWSVLSRMLSRYPGLRRYIVGFDGAGNELDTPPEVFAPLFRRIANEGQSNFTFHAGEDFRHLLSGIRAVWETLEYLELQRGNRIGHATAVGIDPELWLSRFPDRLTLPRGYHLDDLVFTWQLLAKGGKSGAALTLAEPISRLSREVYGRSVAPAILAAAWRLRGLDPILALEEAESGRRFHALNNANETEFLRIDQARSNEEAWQIFVAYHGVDGNGDFRMRYDELIDVKTSIDGLSVADIRYLQDFVLDEISARGVAIETLPTSNVRIACYDEHREHHVARWLDHPSNASTTRPLEICVGSDDPGIFATNLRNEFAHLYRSFELNGRLTAKSDIERLHRCGIDYKFRGMS